MADEYPRFICPKQCKAGFKATASVDGTYRSAEGHASVTAELDEDGEFVKELSIDDEAVDTWDEFEYDSSDIDARYIDDVLVCLKCGEEALDTEDMTDEQVTAELL